MTNWTKHTCRLWFWHRMKVGYANFRRFAPKIGYHSNVPWAIAKKEGRIDHTHPYVYVSWKFGEDRSCIFWDNWSAMEDERKEHRRNVMQGRLNEAKIEQVVVMWCMIYATVNHCWSRIMTHVQGDRKTTQLVTMSHKWQVFRKVAQRHN